MFKIYLIYKCTMLFRTHPITRRRVWSKRSSVADLQCTSPPVLPRKGRKGTIHTTLYPYHTILIPIFSIFTDRMDSETKKQRDSLGNTPDTPLREEQMEVPSSFDESLVRNGRLHRTPYSRRRAREIYETAGIVRHVTETKKRETIRPFPRLHLFPVYYDWNVDYTPEPIVKMSYIFWEIKEFIPCTGNIRLQM